MKVAQAIAKAMKGHEDEAHPPYDRNIRDKLFASILLLNDDLIGLPMTVGRYSLRSF